jgi:hypothetical protein
MIVMKLMSFLLICLNCINANAQSVGDTLLVDSNSNRSVFIDAPHSKFHYLAWEGFRLNINDRLPDTSGYSPFRGLNLDYSGDWITVKRFRNRYYAYCASEPYFNSIFRISDSSLITNDFNDGLVSYYIERRKLKQRKIELQLISIEGVRQTLVFKRKTKKIFIAKSSLLNVKKVYVVKRRDYFEFPIIVNYCPTNRCEEFDLRR